MKQFNEGGRCKCGRCGRTFGGLELFDRHQRTLDVKPWVECLDPSTVTKKKTGDPVYRYADGIWKSAAVDDRWTS